MSSRWTTALLLLAAVALVAVWLFSASGWPAGSSPRPSPGKSPVAATDPVTGSGSSEPAGSPARKGSHERGLTRRLQALLGKLRDGASPSEVLSRLAEIKRLAGALPPERVAAEIVDFLETGEDMPTGLVFEVGPEGVMRKVPTVRTAAIDLLGQSEASQSVEYSRKILRSTFSADEYALALRNLGWSFPAAVTREELADNFRNMLARAEWKPQPSRGFLEAFDIAVVAGLATDVAPLLQNGEPGVPESPLGRAAFVALDRMMLRDPAAIVDVFLRNPQFLAATPFHRASIMTRLDPRDPVQGEMLAYYILRDDHAPGEIDYFAAIFPNPNRFSSHRLVTAREDGGSMENQQQADSAVAQTLGNWVGEPRFLAARKTLESILNRLRSTGGAGP